MALLSDPMAIMISFTILDTVSPCTLQPLRQHLVILAWFLDLYQQRTAFVT